VAAWDVHAAAVLAGYLERAVAETELARSLRPL
jgi:hypothetical protein